MLAAGGWALQAVTPGPLSDDDVHLLFMTGGVTCFPPAPGAPGLRATAPELLRLDNAPLRFAAAKEPGTLRVFCLGGSTTQGWPFQDVASYPRLLGLMLRDALPGRRVEVLNAGLNGSDSTADLRLLRRELARFQPDLLLLHAGLNDATFGPMRGGWRLAALGLHARLLARVPLYSRARARFFPPRAAGAQERLLEWARVPRDPDALAARLERNVAEADRLARAAGARLVLVERPFRDPSGGAHAALDAALRRAAEARGLPVVSSAAALAADRRATLTRAAGTVHPDLAGQLDLARAAASLLGRDGLLAPRAAWRPARLRSDRAYLEELGVTPAKLAPAYSAFGAAPPRTLDAALALGLDKAIESERLRNP